MKLSRSDWIRSAFEENGTTSSARLLSAICTICSLLWISVVVGQTGHLPDATVLGGLSAFNTSHYLVGAAKQAYMNKVNPEAVELDKSGKGGKSK